MLAGFANVAAVDMICANLIGEMVLLSTGTFYPSSTQMLGIFAAVLATHIGINLAGLWFAGCGLWFVACGEEYRERT